MGIFRKDIEAIQQAKQNEIAAKNKAEKNSKDQDKVQDMLSRTYYGCKEEERDWLLKSHPEKWNELRNAAFH